MQDAVTDRVDTLRESEASELLERFYHVPILLALMGVMIAVRLRRIERFQTSSGVTFRGNDPWYHFRETNYLLEHFPSTMPFDVMTNYPQGAFAAQFGTFYDQIVAGFVLLTSFGDPSAGYAGSIMLVAAPVFATAAVIPAYLIAARLTGRGPALAGITVLALLPGTVLNYSLVGFYDHSAAEVFFQTLGVLAFIVGLSVAEREQPVWELVVDRDLDALRRPLLYAVAAGVAAALYMWAWPPGILLVGFTGLFFAVKLTSEVYHGRSPEPIAFVGTVSMTVTGCLMIIPLTSFTIGGSTNYSLLQVVLSLGVAAGCLFLSFLARQWEASAVDEELYPAAVGGILLGLFTIVSVVLPGLINGIVGQLLNTVGLSAGAESRTIGEAQPLLASGSPFDVIYSEYRLAFFTALVAALVMLGRPLIRSDDSRDTIYAVAAAGIVLLIYLARPAYNAIAGVIGIDPQVLGILIVSGLLVGSTLRYRYDADQLYLLVWGAFITSAGFTQGRFNYYLAVVVAVFTAIFVAQVFGLLGDFSLSFDSLQNSAEDVEGWQVIVGVTVVFLIVGPLVFPTVAAWDRGGNNGAGAVQIWDDSIDWMEENTPAPGQLGDADNTIDPQGTYERPPDSNYAYPEGSYGVQSWWDYGHWITVHGDRIPNANPFQQGATEAANYLLAPNETAASDALAEKMGDDGETRYVMVDWKMVTPGSKFAAPTVFNENVSRSDFIEPAYPRNQRGYGRPIQLRTQRYYDSQVVRLYAYHGSAVNPRPIVVNAQQETVDAQGQQLQIQAYDQGTGIQQFDTLRAARAYIDENPNAQLGGIGANPTERVSALEQYRLVHANERSALRQGSYRQNLVRNQQRANITPGNQIFNTPSWVKTFEKVPGATVEGSGAPAGEEVAATVRMEIPTTGRTFSYTQYATADEAGNFEMTVPYSTTGYENFGPENGYTNVSVQAASQYRFAAGQQAVGSAEVSEAQVLGVDEEPVQVELSEPPQVSRQSVQATG